MTGVHRIVYFVTCIVNLVFRWMVLQLSMTHCYHGSPMIFTINRGLVKRSSVTRRLAWLKGSSQKPLKLMCVYVWFRTGQRQLTGFGVYIQAPFLHEIRTLHRAVKYLPPAGKRGVVARSPFPSCVLIYRNTPRKPKVEVTQTIYCGDTMLLLAVVNRGGLRGRPHIHDAQTLDRLIKMHGQGQSVKSIAESLRMPLSTTYRIVQRLS